MSVSLEPATGAAPRTVVWSYRLYLVAAALSVIGIVLTLVLLPAAIDTAVQTASRTLQGQDIKGLDVEGIARGTAIGSAVLGIVIAVAFTVLTVVFARKLRQGRNWARIVLAVFAFLQLFGVISLFGLGLLQFLVAVAAAVLGFLPASNAWFRSRKQVPAPVV